MSEARTFKLKEYFTTVTNHDYLQKSDLSAEKPTSQRRHLANYESQKNLKDNESSMRINDTFRSNVIFG